MLFTYERSWQAGRCGTAFQQRHSTARRPRSLRKESPEKWLPFWSANCADAAFAEVFAMKTSASTVGLAEDRAYLNHHFSCPLCCAAGISGGKQARCTDGQALWDAYNQAAGPPPEPRNRLRAGHTRAGR